MKYISTRGNAPVLSFEEAMLAGLARDGGLYVPETIPQMATADITAMEGLSYEEIALRVIKPFVGQSFSEAELIDSISLAYAGFGHSSRAPLVQLGPNHHLLELFHGPTLAFKDFAMQLIGQLFQRALKRRGEKVTIVGATSGDTGSAAIEAFKGLDTANVFILFPKGRVSEVQRRQMTTPKETNVNAIAMEGTFDTCQAMLKDMFNDFEFRDGVRLAGVNSINWARVLAQVVYYFSSAVAIGAPGQKVSFTVPTGNFGDIFAGYIAKRMGLPIDRLIIAANHNNILHRAITTGRYDTNTVTPTITPSMDIQVSSNFERALFEAYDRDGETVTKLMCELKKGGFGIDKKALLSLQNDFDSGWATEESTRMTIKQIYDSNSEVLCPHSAVGVKVANENLGHTPMITLATAHPAKFPDAVKASMGKLPKLPIGLADLFDRPERLTDMPDDLPLMKSLIWERIKL